MPYLRAGYKGADTVGRHCQVHIYLLRLKQLRACSILIVLFLCLRNIILRDQPNHYASSFTLHTGRRRRIFAVEKEHVHMGILGTILERSGIVVAAARGGLRQIYPRCDWMRFMHCGGRTWLGTSTCYPRQLCGGGSGATSLGRGRSMDSRIACSLGGRLSTSAV